MFELALGGPAYRIRADDPFPLLTKLPEPALRGYDSLAFAALRLHRLDAGDNQVGTSEDAPHLAPDSPPPLLAGLMN